MQSPFFKDDKPGKPDKAEKPEKPEATKDKPFSVPSMPVEAMPPAKDHPNRLVAITKEGGGILYLAFSNGAEWLTLKFGEPVPPPALSDPKSPVI